MPATFGTLRSWVQVPPSSPQRPDQGRPSGRPRWFERGLHRAPKRVVIGKHTAHVRSQCSVRLRRARQRSNRACGVRRPQELPTRGGVWARQRSVTPPWCGHCATYSRCETNADPSRAGHVQDSKLRVGDHDRPRCRERSEWLFSSAVSDIRAVSTRRVEHARGNVGPAIVNQIRDTIGLILEIPT
jgi:hypothetical protein